LKYIASLVIPPAYRNVEIYYRTGRPPKILYMGIDAKGREQFIYSSWWTEQQRSIKLCNLIRFGEALPQIQSDITTHLRREGKWTQTRVIALILRIISLCYFRIGNTKYETLYQSHGISTISKRHIKIGDDGIRFEFIGKKAQKNECLVVDPLAVKSLQDLVGEIKSDTVHIFQYQSGGKWHDIKHTDVNDYLKKYDPVLTSKMFRTWDTNIMLIRLLERTEPIRLTAPQRRRVIVAALREVSYLVHNTLVICRKDYADPDLIGLYLDHPRKYKSLFITPPSSERVKFMNWLRNKCSD
jgi:DNA topoisomerase I